MIYLINIRNPITTNALKKKTTGSISLNKYLKTALLAS